MESLSVCTMNVHKRCKDLVANTCGVNPRLMADILHDMVIVFHKWHLIMNPFNLAVSNNIFLLQGMSVNKLNLPKKGDKSKQRAVSSLSGGSAGSGDSESEADLDKKLETQLQIAAQVKNYHE